MLAYVEGRPIPAFSSSFTSVASLKRGGGLENFCSGSIENGAERSPCFTLGKFCSLSEVGIPEAR